MYKLGIDIGGTKINIGILNQENQLLGNKKIYIKEIDHLSSAVKAQVDLLCHELGICGSELQSCGIGVPGTVSEDGRRLLKAPNIKILSETVADDIAGILQMPTVLVQDSRAAAWGEYQCGNGQGACTLVCITLGTGIGTGIVMDGRIYHGALGSAGEMGHIPVCEAGRACGCGKRGCLEKYAAGGGLDLTAQEILGEGKTAADLFQEARDGDVRAISEIQQAVKLLGNAVVAIVNLLSPDCILFSGGLSEQKALYVDPLIHYVKAHCYSSGKLPRLEIALLGENAPMVGAALMQ